LFDVENEIRIILKEEGRMRTLELERRILSKDDSCSKKTFYKHLNDLVEFSLDITRTEVSRQIVWYEHEDFLELDENIAAFFNVQNKEYEIKIKEFLKNENKLTLEQKGDFLAYLIELLDHVETIARVAQLTPRLKNSDMLKIMINVKIIQLKKSLYAKFKKYFSDPIIFSSITMIKNKNLNDSKILVLRILDSLQK
jgi:hypothetical protein